jgi:hypothetical protein
VAIDPPPDAGGLWSRHMPCGPQPPRHAHAFPRRRTSGSLWPQQARGADNALNAYKTSHTQCLADIKCVQDIDTAGRRQYGADLLVTRNGQATMRGDLMLQCHKAATVSGDPSTHTIPRMDTAWQSDVTFNRSSALSLAIPS